MLIKYLDMEITLIYSALDRFRRTRDRWTHTHSKFTPPHNTGVSRAQLSNCAIAKMAFKQNLICILAILNSSLSSEFFVGTAHCESIDSTDVRSCMRFAFYFFFSAGFGSPNPSGTIVAFINSA